MKNIINDYFRELKAMAKDVAKFPPGDERAEKINLIARATGELIIAEGEADRGRDVQKHLDRIEALIKKVLNHKE